METKLARDSRMHSLMVLYDLHTKLYYNVIHGISDKDAHNRLNTKANHVAWIAGSLVNERFELVNILNKDSGEDRTTPTSPELFTDHKGIQDQSTYPSLDEYRKDWENISPVLRENLVALTAEQLDGADPYEMPGESSTLFDTLAFMIDRESYCIGQIGLYRRLLGYEAMKYQ